MKIGEALAKRDMAPHIYESGEEAKKLWGRSNSHFGCPDFGFWLVWIQIQKSMIEMYQFEYT